VISLSDIRNARLNITGYVHQTDTLFSTGLSRMNGCDIFLKTENLQKTGSFKVRGAFNKMLSLTADERKRGVITFSSGNHAQAVAFAGQMLGIPATVVMPPWGNPAKLAAAREYGARIVLYGQNSVEMASRAWEIQKTESLAFVHPFDDPLTIAGQGTVGLEILESQPLTDCIFVPIGGGGLIGGIAAAVKNLNPSVRVIGVQPERSCSMLLSRQAGQIVEIDRCATAADGLVAKRPGILTFQLVEQYVDDIVTVTEDEIESAMILLLQRSKLLTEPSGAVGLAGLLGGKAKLGRKNVAVLSGGNCNLSLLGETLTRHFAK
jgi:threonine ammonia-lyase medium form